MERNDGFDLSSWMDVAEAAIGVAIAANVIGDVADVASDCCNIL